MIQQVQNSCQFHGLPGDDANKHLDKFLTVTKSMKQNGVPDDSLRVFLFPYSLTHHDTAWFDHLPKNSIHTFEEMVSKFLTKYFPLSMVTKLRNDISNFRQLPNESLFKAWERYKLPIDRCPNHNMLPVTQKDTFYNGLSLRHRDIINAAAGEPTMDQSSNIQVQKVPARVPSLMFKKLHFNISFAEVLAQMPKYAKMLKDLLYNKEKLLELANTPLNENCSAVLLKKLPEKLGDHRKFLIPCDFSELEECLALADVGASINLMSLFVWKKLMLPELKPTRMTLELANRSVAYPTDIVEDAFVQVGKFTFLADFDVVEYDVDPHVLLILGRPFLRTARALVDVYGEELTFRVGDEKLVFNVESTLKYPHKQGDESINQIDIIDIQRG
ncbi:reverse transcriptase domain-containing protein [Tanacetum coccineum]